MKTYTNDINNPSSSTVPSTAAASTPSSTSPTSQLPKGYLANGYMNQDGEPDYKYVQNIAMEIAKKLAPMKQSTFYKLYQRVEYTKFLDLNKKIFEINRLVPVAANLVSHGKAPEILLDFFEANIAVIKTVEDWLYFRYHMEAICGYMEIK